MNFWEKSKDNFLDLKLISVVLYRKSIWECFKVSDHQDFQICLKRQTDICFVNNYFNEGLFIWKLILTSSPFSTTAKSSYTCVDIFQRKKMNVCKKWNSYLKKPLKKEKIITNKWNQLCMDIHQKGSVKTTLNWNKILLVSGFNSTLPVIFRVLL